MHMCWRFHFPAAINDIYFVVHSDNIQHTLCSKECVAVSMCITDDLLLCVSPAMLRRSLRLQEAGYYTEEGTPSISYREILSR